MSGASERAPERTRRVASIALAGCGAVGGALLDRLERASSDLRVVSVLVRDVDRYRDLRADTPFTCDLDTFLATEADLVVEALGGVDTAARVARTALERGAHLVTANKALVAAHGPELHDMATNRGATLRYDAAVGGGVPVIRTIETALPGVPIRRITGVLNGTANYLLTRLEGGERLEDALDEAKSAGYAEADPSRDLDGRDVADKLTVLAWVAWRIAPDDVTVECSGLPPDAAERAHRATERGRRLRLIGDLVPTGDGGATARVECREVGIDSVVARARGVENLVRIETDCGDFTLTGPGAGGEATSAAVLADVRAALAGAPQRGTERSRRRAASQRGSR